ncbi:MAG: hypothetical protein ACI85Q_001674 [Salibacteraceae bacterium]|jgi:hypothetical protein
MGIPNLFEKISVLLNARSDLWFLKVLFSISILVLFTANLRLLLALNK